VNIANEIIDLQKTIEAKKQSQARIEGQLDGYLKTLKTDFNVSSVEEAKSLLQKKEKELREKEEKLQKDYDKFMEEYSEYF
jgi:uncharacterized protein YdbL (DUF1318 family)